MKNQRCSLSRIPHGKRIKFARLKTAVVFLPKIRLFRFVPASALQPSKNLRGSNSFSFVNENNQSCRNPNFNTTRKRKSLNQDPSFVVTDPDLNFVVVFFFFLSNRCYLGTVCMNTILALNSLNTSFAIELLLATIFLGFQKWLVFQPPIVVATTTRAIGTTTDADKRIGQGPTRMGSKQRPRPGDRTLVRGDAGR